MNVPVNDTDRRIMRNIDMKRRPILLFLASLIASGCGGDTKPTQPDLDSGSIQSSVYVATGNQKGERAVDFTLNTAEGNPISLRERLGKPIFLNFWATWCGPCLVEMPDIERLQKEMGGQIQIFGIDLRESPSLVKEFVKKQKFTWIFLLDTTGEVGSSYAVSAIPTSIFINAKGIITGRQVGTLSFERMKQLAQEALKD